MWRNLLCDETKFVKKHRVENKHVMGHLCPIYNDFRKI